MDANWLDSLSARELRRLHQRVEAALGEREAGEPAPVPRECRLFSVREGVRHLDPDQLEKLSAAFEEWAGEARNIRVRRSRERVLMAYLVLRYSGARLGEVLALDERENFDFEGSLVRFQEGEGVREVPLPPFVTERILRLVRDQSGEFGPGRMFHLDQGFIRRKFHEQKPRSGLSKELLNPRVLRNSRAIELLRGGMPLKAVQNLLGHSTAEFTSSYVTMDEADLRNIIVNHVKKEFEMETSARNVFSGKVVKIVSTSVMTEVVVETDSGYQIVAVITNSSREKLGLIEGGAATALVKASWVLLEKAKEPAPTSARNAFPGKVTDVRSDGVMAEVDGVLDDGTPVCALITVGSLNKLGIGGGDSFVYFFKATSVILS